MNRDYPVVNWWDIRVPRSIGNKTLKEKIAIWQWATQSDTEVACDICGVPVAVHAGNVITNGPKWPIWVDVLCNYCWRDYADD